MMRSTSIRSTRRSWRQRSLRVRSELGPVLRLFLQARPNLLWLGAALAVLTVLMGMGLQRYRIRRISTVRRHPAAGVGAHRGALWRAAGDTRCHACGTGRSA